MTFSDWITEELNKRDWNQSDLAKMLGITRAAVSNIINGKTERPSDETIEGIAKAFGVSKEIVMRHANILPQISKREERIKRIEYKISKIDDSDDLATIEGMIDLLSPDKRRKGDKRVTEQ